MPSSLLWWGAVEIPVGEYFGARDVEAQEAGDGAARDEGAGVGAWRAVDAFPRSVPVQREVRQVPYVVPHAAHHRGVLVHLRGRMDTSRAHGHG